MNEIRTRGHLALLGILWLSSASWAAHSESTKNSDRGDPIVRHRFLKCGWNSKGVEIVSADLKTEWKHPGNVEWSDAWYLADGGVVISFSHRKPKKICGIKRFDRDGKLKWTWTSDEGFDNHTCQPLPDGRFLAGLSTKERAYMAEIDDTGKKVAQVEVELPQKVKERSKRDIHHVFRHCRKTSEGTYLAAAMSYGKAIEWDAGGKIIREFPQCRYGVFRLPNGNTVVTGKLGVLEYDKRQKVVWSMQKADFARLNLQIRMICGAQRLPNGNTVISNVDHGKLNADGDYYKLVEVTQGKKLVWWVDHPRFKGMNIGSFQVIDVKGDPAKGEVWK